MKKKYRRDLYISWEELHRDARLLCVDLLESERRFQGIIAVARGGLIPAAIVARELDVRLVDTVCAVSYKGSQARECNMTLDEWRSLQSSIAADQSGESAANGEPTSC